MPFRTKSMVVFPIDPIVIIQAGTRLIDIGCMNLRHLIDKQRRVIANLDLIDRGINPRPAHVRITNSGIMTPERLAAILKIGHERAMPYPPHGIDLTEPYRHTANILKRHAHV